MFQRPKLQGLVLPSVEQQPHIFRDPPRSLVVRKSEKVDVADTMHLARTGDRIDENINWVPRGVDPVAGIQFSNGAGMTPMFSQKVQGHSAYKVARDGAFRPPMRRQEDMMPVSRMPRLATTLQTNPGSEATVGAYRRAHDSHSGADHVHRGELQHADVQVPLGASVVQGGAAASGYDRGGGSREAERAAPLNGGAALVTNLVLPPRTTHEEQVRGRKDSLDLPGLAGRPQAPLPAATVTRLTEPFADADIARHTPLVASVVAPIHNVMQRGGEMAGAAAGLYKLRPTPANMREDSALAVPRTFRLGDAPPPPSFAHYSAARPTAGLPGPWTAPSLARAGAGLVDRGVTAARSQPPAPGFMVARAPAGPPAGALGAGATGVVGGGGFARERPLESAVAGRALGPAGAFRHVDFADYGGQMHIPSRTTKVESATSPSLNLVSHGGPPAPLPNLVSARSQPLASSFGFQAPLAVPGHRPSDAAWAPPLAAPPPSRRAPTLFPATASVPVSAPAPTPASAPHPTLPGSVHASVPVAVHSFRAPASAPAPAHVEASGPGALRGAVRTTSTATVAFRPPTGAAAAAGHVHGSAAEGLASGAVRTTSAATVAFRPPTGAAAAAGHVHGSASAASAPLPAGVRPEVPTISLRPPTGATANASGVTGASEPQMIRPGSGPKPGLGPFQVPVSAPLPRQPMGASPDGGGTSQGPPRRPPAAAFTSLTPQVPLFSPAAQLAGRLNMQFADIHGSGKPDVANAPWAGGYTFGAGHNRSWGGVQSNLRTRAAGDV